MLFFKYLLFRLTIPLAFSDFTFSDLQYSRPRFCLIFLNSQNIIHDKWAIQVCRQVLHCCCLFSLLVGYVSNSVRLKVVTPGHRSVCLWLKDFSFAGWTAACWSRFGFHLLLWLRISNFLDTCSWGACWCCRLYSLSLRIPGRRRDYWGALRMKKR